jgi:proline iminopeptidase
VNNTQTVDEGMLSVDGADIYYKTIGSGEPLVFVHGGPGLGHNYLYPCFKHMADHFQIVFYDQRSSGRSSGIENPGQITVDAFVEDLEELRKALDIKELSLIAHSWGGFLCQHYAVKYPENIKALLFIESLGPNSEFISQFNRTIEKRLNRKTVQKLMLLSESFGKRKEDMAESFKEYYYLYFKAYFYDQSFIDHLYLDYFDDDMVAKYLMSNPCLKGYQQHYDLSEKLSVISSPTLIIHSDYDPIPLHAAQQLHGAINGSKLVIIKDSGHFPFIEKPENCFGAIYDFLL